MNLLSRFVLTAAIVGATAAIVMVTTAIAIWNKDPPPKPIPAPSYAPIPSTSAPAPFVLPPPSDFDFNKKDRQVDWCEAHHGVATMSFTVDQSNVICLKPWAVIPLPADL